VTQAVAAASAVALPFGTNVEIADHPPGIGRFVISNESGWLIGKVPADVADFSCIPSTWAIGFITR
jgi:hypothetical protein